MWGEAPCHVVSVVPSVVIVLTPGPISHSSQLIWPPEKTAALHSVALRPSVGSDWDRTGTDCDGGPRMWLAGGEEAGGRRKLVYNWSPAEAWTWTPVKLGQLKIESTEQYSAREGGGESQLDSSVYNINIQLALMLWCNHTTSPHVKRKCQNVYN